MQNKTFYVRRALAFALAGSMMTTVFLLMLQGRWQEAIPLHLCSLAALAAVILALRPRVYLLDFLWYLGMPGAALALLFPAPAVSRFQTLMTGSYVTTHALILLIPAYLMVLGMRPGTYASGRMLLTLNAVALCAALVNGALGTDFLFLSAPAAGTPLEAVYQLGMPAYLCCLELLMAALCLMMERLARMLCAENPAVMR